MADLKMEKRVSESAAKVRYCLPGLTVQVIPRKTFMQTQLRPDLATPKKNLIVAKKSPLKKVSPTFKSPQSIPSEKLKLFSSSDSPRDVKTFATPSTMRTPIKQRSQV